jgi:hypothetical protein
MTIATFAAACSALNSDQIYVLYEDMLNDETRDLILSTYPCNKSTSEPVRAALSSIGMQYNVKSLIDY